MGILDPLKRLFSTTPDKKEEAEQPAAPFKEVRKEKIEAFNSTRDTTSSTESVLTPSELGFNNIWKDIEDPQQRQMIMSYFNVMNDSSFQNKLMKLEYYRNIATYPLVNDCVDEIVNSAIAIDDNGKCMYLKFNNGHNIQDSVKEIINKEFEHISAMFDFENNGDTYFRRFIVDGEICWENLISQEHPEEGIVGINPLPVYSFERLIDPYLNYQGLIFNVRVVNGSNQADMDSSVIYDRLNYTRMNQQVASASSIQSIRPDWINSKYSAIEDMNDPITILPKEQLTYVYNDSTDSSNLVVFPVLDKVRKIYNQLELLENSAIIMRLSRAPVRLSFTVGVGAKVSDQRADEITLRKMKQFQTQRKYDPATGSLTKGYDAMSMLESFWSAKRDGSSAATSVEALNFSFPNFDQIDDIKYWTKKLLGSLKIPETRFSDEGANTEHSKDKDSISYAEFRFAQSVINYQRRFSKALTETLKTHLKLLGYWDKYNLDECTNAFIVQFNSPVLYDMFIEQKMIRAKHELYQLVTTSEDMSKEMAQKTILGWSEQLITDNKKMVENELLRKSRITKLTANIEANPKGYYTKGEEAEGEQL